MLTILSFLAARPAICSLCLQLGTRALDFVGSRRELRCGVVGCEALIAARKVLPQEAIDRSNANSEQEVCVR